MKSRIPHATRAWAIGAAFAGAFLFPAAAHADDAKGTPPSARASRHALIIGIGEYLSPTIPSLNGIKHDMESAATMAGTMSIPKENIRFLRDHDATAARIEYEIAELNKRIQPGDRVFLYYSGHGSRWYDESIKKDGCVEALLASDSKPLTNQKIAAMLRPISDKTDKLFVFYDACHSGGVVDKPLMTRAWRQEGKTLTPKFSPVGVPAQCATPANIRTRSFSDQAQRLGGLPQNIVQISSSRQDEISFDDETSGGLATQAWRDCMLGEARDLDRSGAISVEEISACAQSRLDSRFAENAQYAAPHITIGGNKSFIPNLFASPAPVQLAQAAATTASTTQLKPTTTQVAPTQAISSTSQSASTTQVAAPALPKPPASAALSDIYEQRDARRKVLLKVHNSPLKIGKDVLDLSVNSSHDGYMYLVLLGSDNKSFYLLFPNDLDKSNAIKAGETLKLPRKNWQITAQGPAGTDKMLVVISESPRALSLLGQGKSGPFLSALTDAKGRANLQWLLGTSINQASSDCSHGGQERNSALAQKCSDAFGAALADIVEK
jgi:hypothetical protein